MEHTVVHADGTREVIPASDTTEPAAVTGITDIEPAQVDLGPTTRRPLGTVVAARSGDKGGNANVGVWTDTPERWDWLRSHLDVQRFRRLIPEAGELPVRRYEFDNLKALNFVIVGYLGQGVASCTKTDPQAKGLGEYLRSVYTEIPDKLVP